MALLRAKISLLATPVSLSLFHSARSCVPLLIHVLAVFAAFQSGKFSNAITLPPCVCLDKGIMRFYASCACFHGNVVVYAPAWPPSTARAFRGSFDFDSPRLEGVQPGVRSLVFLSLNVSLYWSQRRESAGSRSSFHQLDTEDNELLSEKTSIQPCFPWFFFC